MQWTPQHSPKDSGIGGSICLEAGVKIKLEIGKLFKDFLRRLFPIPCIRRTAFFCPKRRLEV